MGRDLTAWQDDHRRPLPTTCNKPSETSASEQVVRINVSQVRPQVPDRGDDLALCPCVPDRTVRRGQ